ncbi:MAG TPA: hypothetical protein VIX61_12590 [Casimicrobiaceae bacterium]
MARTFPAELTIVWATCAMKTLLVAIALTLTACAAGPTVVPAPDGTLTVTRRGNQLGDATGPLRVQALKDADAYCAASKKRANVLRSREIAAIRHWPEAEVSFVCE